jgi:5'-nucleotidase
MQRLEILHFNDVYNIQEKDKKKPGVARFAGMIKALDPEK